jgi:hypothetical protein
MITFQSSPGVNPLLLWFQYCEFPWLLLRSSFPNDFWLPNIICFAGHFFTITQNRWAGSRICIRLCFIQRFMSFLVILHGNGVRIGYFVHDNILIVYWNDTRKILNGFIVINISICWYNWLYSTINGWRLICIILIIEIITLYLSITLGLK